MCQPWSKLEVQVVSMLLAGALLTPRPAAAELIPAARRIDWSQAGVPGGIPARTQTCAELTSIDNTGATDVRAAIQAALDACPEDHVVKLPVGTFRVNGSLSMPSHVTLRGAGPSTVVKSYGNVSGLFLFGESVMSWDPTAVTTTIVSGNTAGSQSLVVASANGISAGSYLVISELNDAAFVSIQSSLSGQPPATWVDGWNTAGVRARGQIVEVTSVSGTTVGIAPPLYADYANTPWATRFAAACEWAGVEDLKTYANDTGTARNFLFQNAAYSWVKDVESDYADCDHVTLDWSYRCEVRGSYFHDSFVHSSGNCDNMIGLRSKTSGTLIVDNILRRLHISIMLEWGAAGNVIAYNYSEGDFDENAASGNRWLPGDLNLNHGAHPQFNLIEGNIVNKIAADSYWGSSSHTTLYRNVVAGTGVAHPPYSGRGVEDTSTTATLVQANRGVDIWELQGSYTIIGNVVGSAPLSARDVVRRVVNPAPRGYDNPPVCFSYGYNSEASGGSAASTNPATTVIEHGNWDVASDGVVWDPSNSDHTLPASLFLPSRPAWWDSCLSWPSVGADVAPAMNDNPAKARYEHRSCTPHVSPAAPSNLRAAP